MPAASSQLSVGNNNKTLAVYKINSDGGVRVMREVRTDLTGDFF
jgi:hypothetical protein